MPHPGSYHDIVLGLSLNQVKLQLAREEEARVRTAQIDESSDTSLSGFILLGLEIEDAQYVLSSLSHRSKLTSLA